MRVRGEVLIRRPVADVFHFVADERNNYDPTIDETELLTEGPIGVGTRFRCRSTSRGRPVDMIVEIVQHDRPHRLVTTTHLAGLTIISTLLFVPAHGGTVMRWASDIRPHGLLRPLAPVLALYGRRQTRAIWANLKTTLEDDAARVAVPR